MKGLTVWQPWASLIAWKEKEYETRAWETDYRGPLLIHASMGHDASIELAAVNASYRKACDRQGFVPRRGRGLPVGVILCVVDLEDVVKTEEIGPWVSAQEQAFGDWSFGRYAWKLGNVRALKRPLPIRGRQGLWEWDGAEKALRKLL